MNNKPKHIILIWVWIVVITHVITLTEHAFFSRAKKIIFKASIRRDTIEARKTGGVPI
jgi:hypothetical protein